MTPSGRNMDRTRPPLIGPRLVGVLALGLIPDRAEAQWGYGFGWRSPSFNYVA